MWPSIVAGPENQTIGSNLRNGSSTTASTRTLGGTSVRNCGSMSYYKIKTPPEEG